MKEMPQYEFGMITGVYFRSVVSRMVKRHFLLRIARKMPLEMGTNHGHLEY